jgi:hypothetical protein
VLLFAVHILEWHDGDGSADNSSANLIFSILISSIVFVQGDMRVRADKPVATARNSHDVSLGIVGLVERLS